MHGSHPSLIDPFNAWKPPLIGPFRAWKPPLIGPFCAWNPPLIRPFCAWNPPLIGPFYAWNPPLIGPLVFNFFYKYKIINMKLQLSEAVNIHEHMCYPYIKVSLII